MESKIKGTTIVQVAEIEWTEIKFRELTEEERADLDLDEDDDALVFDCKLPEDDQRVLLTLQAKNGDLCVATDTFYEDSDGPYLEFWEWDKVIAWAPMPEPFKP